MTRILLSCFVSLWMAVSVVAQLTVTTKNVVQVMGLENSEELNGYIFVKPETKVGKKNVALVYVETDASGVSFEVSGSDRSLVDYDQISKTAILISASGKSWVEVVAIDFEKQIYARKIIVVDVGKSDDPDVPDPIPEDIANDYGLGKIAYDEAPGKGKEEVASAYEEAANFLYGVPKAKTVSQTLEFLQGETKKAGIGWEPWQVKMSAALVDSQEKLEKGYAKQDWYKAYNEIANALRYSK